MSFQSDLDAFFAKTKFKAQAVFVNTAVAVKDSIVHGSSITGAPGQPVQTGYLKDSWQGPVFETPTSALISTNVAYARVIEDNDRGATLRSKVGGFHSVRYTVAGFERLVESELAKVAS